MRKIYFERFLSLEPSSGIISETMIIWYTDNTSDYDLSVVSYMLFWL